MKKPWPTPGDTSQGDHCGIVFASLSKCVTIRRFFFSHPNMRLMCCAVDIWDDQTALESRTWARVTRNGTGLAPAMDIGGSIGARRACRSPCQPTTIFIFAWTAALAC